jgi:hypothetical protein
VDEVYKFTIKCSSVVEKEDSIGTAVLTCQGRLRMTHTRANGCMSGESRPVDNRKLPFQNMGAAKSKIANMGASEDKKCRM